MKKITIYLLTLLTLSCTPLISLYDADTFKDTTELKARCMILMTHGTEPFADYSRDADAVLASAWSLYERQKVRSQNNLTFGQWQLLMDDKVMSDKAMETKAILPPFFERWKKEGRMGSAYVEEKRKIVERAFNEILKLESVKIRQNAFNGN